MIKRKPIEMKRLSFDGGWRSKILDMNMFFNTGKSIYFYRWMIHNPDILNKRHPGVRDMGFVSQN